jgi:hypothetical protein
MVNIIADTPLWFSEQGVVVKIPETVNVYFNYREFEAIGSNALSVSVLNESAGLILTLSTTYPKPYPNANP